MSEFSKTFLESQKKRLLTIKQEILNTMNTRVEDDLAVSADQVIEDGDQAQNLLNQSVTLGLRERELTRLREIDAALERIQSGTYGLCEETDEPIEKKRLEKMPWARLSIQAAEEREREYSQFKAM